MGVAPEAIVENFIFSSIGSNIMCSFFIRQLEIKLLIILSGTRSALPMVVAPKAIVECFSDIVSKIDSCIVGANCFSLLPCHHKLLYSIFVEYTHLSSIPLVLYLLHDVSGQISLYVT
jgi:hypothetical protein